jgi:hypothetical protein
MHETATFHRAGHVVVGWLFGLQDVEDPADDALRIVELEKIRSVIDTVIQFPKLADDVTRPVCGSERDQFEERIMYHLAGPLAVQLRQQRDMALPIGLDGSDCGLQDGRRAEDFATAICVEANEREPFLRWMGVRTANLLSAGWPNLEVLADELGRDPAMTDEDARRVLDRQLGSD